MLQLSKSLLWILLIIFAVKCGSSSALQVESLDQKEPARIQSLTEVGHSNLEGVTVLNHGHKLYYIFFQNFRLSWYDALAYCSSIGMSLASPSNETEDLFLKKSLKDKEELLGPPIVGKRIYYWLSLNNLGSRDVYVWMSTGKRINYKFDWVPGDPIRPDVDVCVLYGYGYHDIIGMKAEHCTTKEGFICEK